MRIPPGFKIRENSLIAATASGTCSKTSVQRIQSKLSSSTEIEVISDTISSHSLSQSAG